MNLRERSKAKVLQNIKEKLSFFKVPRLLSINAIQYKEGKVSVTDEILSLSQESLLVARSSAADEDGGLMSCAEDELDGDIIVSYGDIVYSQEILKSLLKSKADIAVTIDKEWEGYWRERNENPLDDAETLKLRRDGTIKEIGKTPKSIAEIEGQYMGLMKFSAKGVTKIKNIFHKAAKNRGLQGKNENTHT